MGLWRFFTGRSPEDIERAGDEYYRASEFGAAKLEYEKALEKTQRKGPENQHAAAALRAKVETAKEALARAHLEHGGHLMESHNFAEAEDLFRLALELTGDPDLKQEINAALRQLCDITKPDSPDIIPPVVSHPAPVADAMDDEDAYFGVLCNAMPDTVREAYQTYGLAFKQGFIALNNADFKTAAKKLSIAFEEHPGERSLIALELATALMNLEQYDRASDLVSRFIEGHPDELRGYQILCDIDWAMGNFEDAVSRIENSPASLRETLPVQMLLGETYFYLERYADARAVFLACQSRYGQNELISRSLAKTFEATGDVKQARDIYGQILSGCASCGARTDPFVRRRYAELCFAAGERSSRLLESYFALAQEDPDSREECHQRISEIYAALGNEKEARRYQPRL